MFISWESPKSTNFYQINLFRASWKTSPFSDVRADIFPSAFRTFPKIAFVIFTHFCACYWKMSLRFDFPRAFPIIPLVYEHNALWDSRWSTEYLFRDIISPCIARYCTAVNHQRTNALLRFVLGVHICSCWVTAVWLAGRSGFHWSVNRAHKNTS